MNTEENLPVGIVVSGTILGPADEVLSEYDDDGTMPANVETLREAVVGHKIVSVRKAPLLERSRYSYNEPTLELTLDDGTTVVLSDTSDCCAYTALNNVIEHLPSIDHFIAGVETTDAYTRWHLYCDLGDVLELEVGWSCGNPFYYGYGFDIDVKKVEA